MGSPAFGLESNNAPLPIPGGYGNPTGVSPAGAKLNNKSQPTLLGPQAFPSYPSFGPLTSANPTSPTTPSANTGAFGSTNLQGLQSGLIGGGMKNNGLSDKLFKQLSDSYGPGVAGILHNFLNNGTFNPQVAAAFLNAMQPGIARGEADINAAFGQGGSRFSSSAALGIGDYLSQVNNNEQATLASLYEQSQNQELSLLQNILPTLHAEEANKGGSVFADILGGLEIAGGIAGAPFTGGLSLGLVGAGIGTLTSANSGKKDAGGANTNLGSPTGNSLDQIIGMITGKAPGSVVNSSTPMGPAPNDLPIPGLDPTTILGISGGEALGGSNPYSAMLGEN